MLNFESFHGVMWIGKVGHSIGAGIDDSFVLGEDLVEMFVLFEHFFMNRK